MPRTHTISIWTYDEADDDLKEKIIENLRRSVEKNSCNSFADDEGIFYKKYSEERQFAGTEYFKNSIPKVFNVGYGHE